MFEENHHRELIELQTLYEINFIENAYAEIEKSNEIEYQIRNFHSLYFELIQEREEKYFNELIRNHLEYERNFINPAYEIDEISQIESQVVMKEVTFNDFIDSVPFGDVSRNSAYMDSDVLVFILNEYNLMEYCHENNVDNYQPDFDYFYYDYDVYNENLFDKFDEIDYPEGFDENNHRDFGDIYLDNDYFPDFIDEYMNDFTYENEFDEYEQSENNHINYLYEEFYQEQLQEEEYFKNLIKTHLDYENHFFKDVFCKININN